MWLLYHEIYAGINPILSSGVACFFKQVLRISADALSYNNGQMANLKDHYYCIVGLIFPLNKFNFLIFPLSKT